MFLQKRLLKIICFSSATFFSIQLMAQGQVVSESDIARQPENTPPSRNWVAYTRPGTPPTALMFVNGPGNPPQGCGSVQLTTLSPNEKVTLFNYDHIGKRLADIHNISYYTYRTSGTGSQVAALNVEIDYNGPNVPGGFTTLVFEPVYNMDQGMVVNGVWQRWDAYNGGHAIWWSTRPIPGVCAFNCFVPWSTIVASNPDATVLGGVGLNQGSGNPTLVSAVDAFTFDNATYNFEPSADSDGDGQGDACDTDDDNDGVPDAIDCDPMDSKNNKVIVCHNGHEICISQNAVNAHLKHGDNLGPCPPATVNKFNVNEKEINEVLPVKATIRNYPDPFVNSTRILYSIPNDSKVSIKIFDMMGREVKTLVNAQMKAGFHEVEFNREKLNSGIYFYRMEIISNGKRQTETKKMIMQ